MERDKRYWEHEEPIVAEAEHLVIRYFPKAEKLQISYPDFSPRVGITKQGKTVVAHLCDLRTDGIKALFREVLGL
jgi:hypothetical protein